MEPFTVESRDGLELHGYLTFPPGLDRRDLPAVLVPHGGPWTRDGWGYDAEAQWLANRGYVCIQVNFRGSAGYGKTFLNAGNREWGGRMHDDLLDAVGWVVAQGWVDPARIGIYGGSYGGYAALIGVAFTPELFACAIAAAAPVNLNTLIESFPPYWAPIIAQAKARIGDPDTEPEFLWSRSPLSRVDDIRSPLLLAQGANDVRVKTTESEQIVAALTQRGIPHQYLLIEGEGHGFVKPANRLRFYRAAEIFLAQHLGGRAEETPDDDPPRTPDPAVPNNHSPDMTVVDLAPL
jgi:dipeptidyl aminopeptidase/acylaminoacyl peptidase